MSLVAVPSHAGFTRLQLAADVWAMKRQEFTQQSLTRCAELQSAFTRTSVGRVTYRFYPERCWSADLFAKRMILVSFFGAVFFLSDSQSAG